MQRMTKPVKQWGGTGISQATAVIVRHKLKCNAPLPTGIGTSPVTGASLHPQMACAVVAQIVVTIHQRPVTSRASPSSAASAAAAQPVSAGVTSIPATMIATSALAENPTAAVA